MLKTTLKKQLRLSQEQSAEYFFDTYTPAKPWSPHDYQKKSSDFLVARKHGALFLDPGLGKTCITLSALSTLKEKRYITKTLIIATLRVCYLVWRQEIEKWSNFNHLSCVLLHGKDKDEQLKKEADIYLINPEGLSWLLEGKTIKACNFDSLVIDELSKFKDISTKRFKLLKKHLDTFKMRWGLTGSPASNGLINLFGQCYILDKGAALGKYVSHYRAEYFTPSFYDWKLKPDSDEKIYERLAPLALRMSSKDHLNMPELIENDIFVDLPKKAFTAYKELEKELITNIQNKTLVASNAASASIKCRQVANGAVYLDKEEASLNKKEWIAIHDEKITALCDLIDELQGSPLLVAYDFKHDLERIREKIGKATPYIGSGVSGAETVRIVNEWNKGNIPVLLGHPQSMAHGLNMQDAGQHVAFFSMTWSLELYEQFIRRVYRQGNTHKTVFVHHILAQNTVDIAMLSAIKSKDKSQRALFDALEKYASM